VRVFEMLIGGRSNSEMPDALGVKPSTVKTHMQNLFDKTGRRSRSGLVALAHELSLPV
jgi:DNA-binding CsgD family transcriptional regulator